ncbi:hypothetical protein WJX77_010254 [Trebouxia sp. C0004]
MGQSIDVSGKPRVMALLPQHQLGINSAEQRPCALWEVQPSKARTESSMNSAVDATHDRAQHCAASAPATMGVPPASSSLPDLTGLSIDEMLRMILTKLSAMDQKMDNLPQRMDSLVEQGDQIYAMRQAAAHYLRQLNTHVSASVGVALQTDQMLPQSGVHPTHATLPEQRPAAGTKGSQAAATQSARTRCKTEANWQRHLHKQRVAQLTPPPEQQLDEQAAAPRPEPYAQSSGVPATSARIPRAPLGAMEGLPGVTATQPQGRPGLPAASMPSAATGVGNTTHPDIPGTGQTAPWTEWRGAYLNLSDGILLNRTKQLRQWPLKVLEHRKKAEAKQHKVQ